jgi:hypothetical protein
MAVVTTMMMTTVMMTSVMMTAAAMTAATACGRRVGNGHQAEGNRSGRSERFKRGHVIFAFASGQQTQRANASNRRLKKRYQNVTKAPESAVIFR